MAKTRQVQWEQNKLQQMLMEADLDEAAAGDTPRSIASGGTPRSFVGTPRSFAGRTMRSMASGSPMAAPYSPANLYTVNTKSPASTSTPSQTNRWSFII